MIYSIRALDSLLLFIYYLFKNLKFIIMKLEWKKNKESNSLEANFAAELLSVSDKTFENKNETKYRIATIDLNGKSIQALMYESNFQHGVEVGKTYLARAIYTEERPEDILVTVSHLAAGERATLADFGGIPTIKEEDAFDKVNAESKKEVA